MISTLFILVAFLTSSAQTVEPHVKPKTEKEIQTDQEYMAHVTDVILKKRKDIDTCKKQTKPKKGKMEVTWLINAKGKPMDFSRGPDTVENNDLFHCLTKKMEKWKFNKPPMDQSIDVKHTFAF